MEKNQAQTKTGNIAYCGLYCEKCPKLVKGKCPGCAGNEKATWCGVRSCCIEHGYKSCADCTMYGDVSECRQFNSPIAKIFGFVFNSDRAKCVRYIKQNGYGAFASRMDEMNRMSLKRGKD